LALAVEAAEGTDAMIVRIGQLRDNLRGTPQKKRGVLVKALKPTQDTKTDMPVVGVETVRRAAEVGLAGIALESGKSLIVGKDAVAAEADRLGLFVVGVTP
ncbi:MAG: UDP-2,3-diacylglucosamine diphosphatase LpxI, partial [Rhizomicrobium sp.]